MLSKLIRSLVLACMCGGSALAGRANNVLDDVENAVAWGRVNTAIQTVTERLPSTRSTDGRARLLTVRAEAYIYEDKPTLAENDLRTAFSLASDKDTRAYIMDHAANAYSNR